MAPLAAVFALLLASPAPAQHFAKSEAPDGATIVLDLFDGARQLFPANVDVLVRVRDGNQKEIVSGYYRGPAIVFDGLPFYDNFGDNYTVIAWAQGYEQAGAFVKLKKDQPVEVDLMLAPKNARFDFSRASWSALQSARPELWSILRRGAPDDAHARQRYEQLMGERPASLACLLNIATALRQIPLGGSTPLRYFDELIWDETLAQDRFFVHADKELLDAVQSDQSVFHPASGALHPGSFISFKQVQFDEANVQLTFHPDRWREVPDDRHGHGKPHIHYVVEPDIDYYADPLAHLFGEVIPNAATGGKTDPRAVYRMRWVEERQAGLDFDPLYDLVR